MRGTLLAFAVAFAMAQGPVPPPGNPGHQQPPPGAACVHNMKDPAHNCTCHRECKDTEGEDGKQETFVQEDPKCRVFCYKEHCHCPISNCE